MADHSDHASEKADYVMPPKKSAKGDLPETEDQWASYLPKLHEHALNARRKHELQWTLNLAYVMGYQNLLYDQRTGILSLAGEVKQPLSVNRIGSFVETRHAKVTKNRPVTRVVPNTADHDDQRAAKYADQSLVYLWRKIGMELQYDKLEMMVHIFGPAFMRTLWDPRAGEIFTRSAREDDVLLLEDDGSIAEEKIFEGEVSSRALSPFNVLPGNELITEMRDQPWIFEDTHLSVGEIEAMYPHLRGQLSKSDSEENFTTYERMVNRMATPLFHASYEAGGASVRDSFNTTKRVSTFWMKPNYQFERGVVACFVDKKLAKLDVWPNDFGDNIYPIVRFAEKENGLHFWGQSTVERLIPIQRSYNRIRQAVDRQSALMAKGKWLVPKGSQLQQDALDDDSGEIVEFNPAVPAPQQAAIAPLPNYVINHMERLITDFRDAGGQRETSLAPGNNLTAGVAMQMQAELSDEIIGPIIRRQGESLELVANTQLMLMNQEWLEARRVKVFGESGQTGVMWLSKADFKNHTDVHVEIESMYPEFKGQKRQTLIDLWDRRIIVDPQKFLKAFRFGSFDMLLEDDERLEDSVVLDLEAIKRGKQPEIHAFQDHRLYFKKMAEFSQTPEFLRLIPERKQLLIQNLQQHLQFLMQSLPNQGQPMEQANQAAIGTPYGSAKPVGAAESG